MIVMAIYLQFGAEPSIRRTGKRIRLGNASCDPCD